MSARRRSRPVAVIGAGLDLGAGRRGVDMGPSAIRYAELAARIRSLGRDVVDQGDVRAPVPEAIEVGDPSHRYLGPIMQVCKRLAELVDEAAGQGQACRSSSAATTRSRWARSAAWRAAHGPGAVLWIDAHGDLNRPTTSPTGNVHGMPLAAALGAAGDAFVSDAFPTPSVTKAALVGVRSLDPGERELIAELGIRVFTMTRDRPPRRRACDRGRARPSWRARASCTSASTSTPSTRCSRPASARRCRGGLSYREAHLALELLAESGAIDSLDVVEVNPILDRENQTAKLAVELVASALGKRILY